MYIHVISHMSTVSPVCIASHTLIMHGCLCLLCTQIQWCIGQARKNRFLPPDYKFTRKTGSKVVPKSNWAYPVSGVLQDLIPFSPDSESVYEAGSHASILQPSEVSLESSLDAESKLALEQSLRYHTHTHTHTYCIITYCVTDRCSNLVLNFLYRNNEFCL